MMFVAFFMRFEFSHGFFIAGIAPHTFAEGEVVPLKVNALTSIHTQVPVDYYRLPFCQPEGGPEMASENLGEFLTGNNNSVLSF